jgi:hypothetical protein
MSMGRASAFGLVLLAACGSAPDEALTFDVVGAAPQLRNVRVEKDDGAGVPRGDIRYHGGEIFAAPVNVYFVYYGAWSGSGGAATGKVILADLLAGLADSPYWRIQTSYTDRHGAPLSSEIRLAATTDDAYSQGRSLDDAKLRAIITSAIRQGRLPKDPRGVYLVLTYLDVDYDESGWRFCHDVCAFHNYAVTRDGFDLRYGWVGNADRKCPGFCQEQSVSPNGNAGVDGMASFIVHELTEAITDPHHDAWYFDRVADRAENENADRCGWKFGTPSPAANGSKANVRLGGRDFLLQENWIHGQARCALSLD